MANCNDNRNPLQRNGTSQPQRLLPQLSPASAPIMDKGPLDWMVWGSRLSAQLRYYNAGHLADGNMEPFFAADIAAQMAMVATHRLDIIPDFTREQLGILHESSNSTKTVLLRRTFTSLFDVLFGYLQRIDSVHQQLNAFEQQHPGMLAEIDFPFQLRNHIQLRLLPVLSRGFSYFKAAKSATLTETTPAGIIDVFNQPIVTAEAVITNGLSSTWWQGNASWAAFSASVNEEPSIFGIAATIAGKIQHASHHNFFTGLLDEVSASAAFLVALSKQSVAKLTSNWPNHEPHYTLYLAWLQLLENARDGMNALTARHLEFYYERVLRLQRLSPAPDKAYLTLELNKAVTASALLRNSAFVGGKDSKGKEIIYKTTRNTVLNKATVESLQSIYLADDKDEISGVSQSGVLFASPVANSKDGNGKKLDSPMGEWHPFYAKKYSNGKLDTIDMPKAAVGFAIASHYLRLKEGKRKIKLKLDCNNNALLAGKKVRVLVTTEKEWMDLGTVAFVNGKMNDAVTNGVVLTFTVDADKPAIVSYSAKVHGHRFSGSEPMLKILLQNNNSVNAATLQELTGLQLERADLEVQVGEVNGVYNNEGLKNLQLQNDAGVLNASKPFQPFGNEPTPGNALIIGSNELFYKPNALVQLNVEWKDLPAETSALDFDHDTNAEYQSLPSTNGPYYPEMDLQGLEGGNWITRGAKLNLFPASGNKLLPNATFKSSLLGGKLFVNATTAYTSYDASTTCGYLRLKLRHDFGHRNYRNALSWYLMEKGKSNPNVSEPAAPYSPVLQSLTISYNASCSMLPGAPNQPLQYWHISPFGEEEATASSATLLPSLVQHSSPLNAQGSLLIGLGNVSAGETISLLFQLMEGTENPLQEKPAAHISWQYLANNIWKNFEENGVDDCTAQLIRSGIIHFIIPEDATTINTLQLPGLLWLKAQVQQAPDAVCKIIGIHTNTVEVQRQLQDGDVIEMLVAPNGTISKMQSPDGKVKKVQQPYASFGGRALESGEAYYVRISERLKHKERAITIWDYERLVLQEFTEIYKVKCLNHTKLTGSAAEGNLQYNEVAPGHVTIITIPNLQQRNDADPLKPYTKKSTLDAIESFLKARTSCHVKLTAAQPKFEEIRLAATVMLADGYEDVIYYSQLLQQEVTAFLSPWAFGSTAKLEFGGSIHKSVLIDFIEERPYVDFLTDVQLFHTPGEGEIESGDLEEAIASTGRSVLVSAAAINHNFKMLTPKSMPPYKIKCKDA